MFVKIYDLDQFFKFCQLESYLIDILEQNHQILYEDLNKILKNSRKSVRESLKINSPFSKFCSFNNFDIIDLDLLQISLFEQTKSITPERYLEKSIFELFNKATTAQIIKKLEKSKLIKNKIIQLDNPFRETPQTTDNDPKTRLNSINILDIFNSPLARAKSKKKIELEFNIKKYNKFDDVLKDILLLDKIFNTPINNSTGLNKYNLDLLYNFQLNKIKQKYKYSLINVNKPFIKLLYEDNIKINDLFLIVKILTQKYEFNRSVFQITDELYNQFKDENSIDKLIKK